MVKIKGVAAAVCFTLVFGTAASAKKTTLQLWDWYKDRMDLVKVKAAEYEKQNPNIEIKFSLVDWNTYPNKVLTSVIGGNPPDVIQFHNSWTGSLLKVLAPFPQEYFPSSKMSDEYYQFSTAFRMKDGKFYFFPDGIMSGVIFYNKRLLAQAGVSGNPKTWDELRLMAKKVTQRSADGKMTVGGFQFEINTLFDDMNYQLGGSTYNAKHTGVDWFTDEGTKAISTIGAMVLNDNIKPAFSGFETNKIGMQYNWTWFKSGLLKIPASKLEWGTFQLPTFNGGGSDIRGRNNYESGYAVPANLKGNKKNEAFKFLKWLYSDDNFYLKLNDTMGRLPGKKSLWSRTEITNDVLHSTLAKQIPYTIFPGERPSWIDDILNKMSADIIAKKISPMDGLKRAQSDADKQWKVLPPKWIVERKLPK